MSKYSEGKQAVTIEKIKKKKAAGEKVAVVTCYDSAFARLINQTDMDMVLVGDSLGNVILGMENTIPVTVEHMIHHCRAVANVLTKPFLVVDMPFGSYQVSPEQSVANAIRLVQEGGAQAVKLEGGDPVIPATRAIVDAGIPVVSHLGLTPQSVHAMSGYKVQGKDDRGAQEMIRQAVALEKAGASMLVLELVPRQLTKEISKALSIPTIGIGAGPDADGQVLVLHDLLGFEEGFKPKFLKCYANMGKAVKDALGSYVSDVKEGAFPKDEHSFH